MGWVCPRFRSSTAWSHVPSWPAFPGGSLRRLGIRLVHSRLGKGKVKEARERDSEVPKRAKRKREGASRHLSPSLILRATPGFPVSFPYFAVPATGR